MDECVPDGETQNSNNVIELQKKLAAIELENKNTRDEFNVQRAKLKEIFLQKEAECKKLSDELVALRKELNETKSQVVIAEYKRESDIQYQHRKAQQEIASLQQLVHETIEESSTSKAEFNRLQIENNRLRNEIANSKQLSAPPAQQETVSTPSTPSLAPVLNQVRKTLVRKLGGDTTSHENLEESMRKAQEDAEVLRSLVIPLEEEIKALKEKLRATDEELQKTRLTGGGGIPASSSNTNFGSALVGMLNESKSTQNLLNAQNVTNETVAAATIATTTTTTTTTTMTESTVVNPENEQEVIGVSCEMCKNYESQLVSSQNDQENLRKDIERFNEELAKEAALRRDLEEKWQVKRDKYKEHVNQLTNQVDHNERELAALQKHYSTFKDEVNQELTKLAVEREGVHRHLNTLQDDNDFLAGRYLASSEEMENQLIDLPSTVEELQETLLQSHQSLIEARVGCEFEQRKCASYLDEIQVLRDQLQTVCAERQASDRDFTARIKSLETHLKAQEIERQKLISIKDAYEKKEIDFNKQSSELRVQVIELRESNDKLERHNNELRNKMSVMQQDMGNSEAVQKDFVRLSQSLQMELEKIRAADTSVRWQNDEDVDNCPSCKTNFTVTRRKQNCRHCGTIYCEKCLTKTVVSGRSNKLARVCDVCHTLLVQNTAPYFSQAPPQSPH